MKTPVVLAVLLAVTGCKKEAASTAALEAAPAANSERLKPANGSLKAQLTGATARAQARKLRPFIELRADWCEPCRALEASLGDPRMVDAFAGTYLITLDVDEWSKELSEAGLAPDGIPAFFAVDERGTPTGRKIDGGAWADNVPANMAPPLKAFFAAR